MSTDNGIYILNLHDQCRVIHATAIENLYTSEYNVWNLKMVYEYFKNAKPLNKSEALELACKLEFNMQQEYILLEYGIRNIYIPNIKWIDIELTS